MKLKFSIFVLLFPCLIYAGNKKKNVEPIVQDSMSIQVADPAFKEPKVNLDSLVLSLKEARAMDSARVIKLADSVKLLQQEILAKQHIIAEREKMLLFDDTCLVVLAYRRTQEPYDESKVMRAISYYDRIFSPSLKKERADVFEALRDYKPAYTEIMDILKRAQGDYDRVGNPFRVEDYRKQYTKELKNSMYYQKYLVKKSVINLPALERLINEALERLSQHSDIKPADFSDLLLM